MYNEFWVEHTEYKKCIFFNTLYFTGWQNYRKLKRVLAMKHPRFILRSASLKQIPVFTPVSPDQDLYPKRRPNRQRTSNFLFSKLTIQGGP